VKIGNEVFVGPNVTFCNDVWPFVDKAGQDFAAFDGTRFSIIVDDGALIGAGAVILPGVRIGKGAVVAAGARVESDVPPGQFYQRNGYISSSIPGDWRERRMRFAK
jgi:UDP-2-acetamido-3-amino-2,3-dideoxy-glucuronate N-acetyltransferase